MDSLKSFFASIYNKTNSKNIDDQTDVNSSKQFSLTPSTIEKIDDKGEENKSYQSVLDIANKLLDKDIKNIAVTGPFGSGKSSVLLTLQKDYPQYNYLNISLATLECDSDDNEDNDNTKLIKGEPKKDGAPKQNLQEQKQPIDFQKESYIKGEDSLNRLIEYSILQQIIYKEKISDIPQSRFKRIKHISKGKCKMFSVGVILMVLACCVLFEPKFLHNQSFYSLFFVGKFWKTIWDFLCLAYIIVLSFYLIRWLITNTYNSKINKLNIKDGEIDITESPSIFNKHLDEIIYFFEVTEYNVIIIEDLDRFKTHSIFLKLRELNNLINSSKAIWRNNNRQIVFIYAVRDDIFKDTSRTKFFDYITTVIPVINPSNSCDKLLKALQDNKIYDIADEVCIDLGIFIDDMRILKNIVNEFIQYRNKLDITKLEAKKLLAMILYKNYYPRDFALLHNQEGIVYQVIKNKDKYYKSVLKQKENEISALQEELNQILHFYSTLHGNELRTLYVMKYIEKLVLVQFFKEGNNSYTPKQIIDNPALFQKLENNVFQQYSSQYTGINHFYIKFKDIEKEVDANFTYQQRLAMSPERLDEIKPIIERLKQEMLEFRALPLHSLLAKYPADDFYHDIKEIHLIAFLLRQGYIDENYYDYISYFYPGTMTASDREFVLDIKIGRKKEYNYKIHKIKAVIDQIPDIAFNKGTTLNIDLVEYIAVNKEFYSKQWTWIVNHIKRKKEFGFIEAYYTQSKDPSIFFNQFFPLWSEFFPNGILKSEKQIADVNFEILLKYFPKVNVGQYNNLEFKDYLSGRFDFISSKLGVIGIDNVKFVTESLGIKYKKIQVDEELSKELVKLLIEGDYYTLSNENIKVLLHCIDIVLEMKFMRANYSAILISKNDNLIDYINENINDCIENVFSINSIHEDEKTIITLAENNEIKEDLKKKYLLSQTNKINDLSSVGKDYWNIVFESNVVNPTWENIEKYISTDLETELSTTIINFISKNSIELSQKKTNGVISESTASKLFIKLIGSNILPIESYRDIRKAFNRQFKSFDLSTIESERLEFLIETEGVKLEEQIFNTIDSRFPNLSPKFLLNNKSQYLSNIALYPLKVNTAIPLLNSDKLTTREKISIIETIPITTFENNSTLSNSICSILNGKEKLTVDSNFVIELIRTASDQKQKLCLFVKKCTESTYDESFVNTGLNLLGGDYANIALQKGNSSKLTLTNEHKILAEYLERNNFISKQFEEDGMIIINLKNIE